MKQEIKAEWVKNLRSGNWSQGHELLGRDTSDQYCVYGVLAEMAAERGICVRETNNAGQVEYDGSCTILPPSVKEWAGIDDDEVPICEPNGMCEHSLYELNDNGGYKFEELADIIEDQL